MEYYGYIYKVTDLVNPHSLPNPFYYGQKKGKFDSNYYGSGKIIKSFVKKYGKKDFKLEQILSVSSLEEANKQEIFQIKENDCIWPKGYNISPGGDGNGGCLKGDKNPSKRPEVRAKRKKSMKEANEKRSKALTGRHYSKEHCESISKAKRGKKAPSHKPDCRCASCMSKRGERPLHKPNCRCVICVGHRNKLAGIPNIYRPHLSTVGRRHIYNLELHQGKTVKPEQLQEYLDKGWLIGILEGLGNLGKKHIYNLELYQGKTVKFEEVQRYLDNGWLMGTLPKKAV